MYSLGKWSFGDLIFKKMTDKFIKYIDEDVEKKTVEVTTV